jgi:hypothetical protein
MYSLYSNNINKIIIEPTFAYSEQLSSAAFEFVAQKVGIQKKLEFVTVNTARCCTRIHTIGCAFWSAWYLLLTLLSMYVQRE